MSSSADNRKSRRLMSAADGKFGALGTRRPAAESFARLLRSPLAPLRSISDMAARLLLHFAECKSRVQWEVLVGRAWPRARLFPISRRWQQTQLAITQGHMRPRISGNLA